MRCALLLFVIAVSATGIATAQTGDTRPSTAEAAPTSAELSSDPRLGDLRNLNGYFPFTAVEGAQQWSARKAEIRRRILVSQGLWPLPTRTDLNAVVHGRVDREDYTVDRVFFESLPGHFVTGSLYRPKGQPGPFPAILSPHGHWSQGRFYDAGEDKVGEQIAIGAEQDPIGGRYVIQARAVQLARMGCIVFIYDMTGNADSVQIAHRPQRWAHLDTESDWGFMSVQADLRLQNMMGLQSWNSIRVIDFLLEQQDVDPNRIGVTGASGGGTQSMMISAIDDRIAAAMPCVMVSTAMQGGCTCENAHLLRIDQGNIDIAAATAPRPLGLTAADDWTVELQTKGYPELVRLFEMLGHPERLSAVFHTEFQHNYNRVNRAAMYQFFNRHFELGLEEPILERPYQPLTHDEATVWTQQYPKPSGDHVGDAHEIELLKMATEDSDSQLQNLASENGVDVKQFKMIVGGGWATILGRRLDQIGVVELIPSASGSADTNAGQVVGRLVDKDRGEQVAIQIARPKIEPRGVLVWITDRGLASFEHDSELADTLERVNDAGYVLLTADLIGQGDPSFDAQPMWYQPKGEPGWKRFSGYTYGYNHSLFVKRVHDILTMIAYAKQMGAGPIHLVGMGEIAGPLALAARSQSGSDVAKTVVALDGFRFQRLRQHDDPMFVPGAVKYLDVDGILATCEPAQVRLMGKPVIPVAKRVYSASATAGRAPLSQADLQRGRLVEQVIDYLSP